MLGCWGGGGAGAGVLGRGVAPKQIQGSIFSTCVLGQVLGRGGAGAGVGAGGAPKQIQGSYLRHMRGNNLR